MKRIINEVIFYSFVILSIFVLILSIAGYFRYEQFYLDFISSFRLQYLLISLCTLFFWLLKRYYYWMVLSFFSIVINLISIVPWYIAPQQPIVDTEYETVKILAFNVLHHNQSYQEVIKLVENHSVDIAAFLEATPPWNKQLLALKDTLPYHFSAEKLQIEVFSKYPLNNPTIQVYGDNRGWVSSQLEINQSNFIFVATHTYAPHSGNVEWQIRNEQLQGIGYNFRELDQPIIIGGDLNITMWSSYYKLMMVNSGLQNARRGFGILPTFSRPFPQISWLAIPLDHFLVSKDIIVTNMETENYLGSDHLPILMDALIPID